MAAAERGCAIEIHAMRRPDAEFALGRYCVIRYEAAPSRQPEDY